MGDEVTVPLFARPFYFLRHGESAANRAKIIAGSLDVELTDDGRKQARASIVLLRPLGIARVASSDLRRARDTAAIIAGGLGLPHDVVPELGERNWGSFEGRPRAERKRGEQPADGESVEVFIARTRAGLARVEAAGAPLVVAHSGTYRVLCRLLGLREADAPVANARPVRFTPPAQTGGAWTVAMF